MTDLLLAISFLTILPLYGHRIASDKEFAHSLYYYPVVGFLIGAVLMGTAHGLQGLHLGLAGDALIVVMWAVITGALHLDGLMDSADGLFSGRDRDRKLEIMKDSRVGAMGAITLLMVIMLKLCFLNYLPVEGKYWALLAAPAAGRFIMVYAVASFPYARASGGLGKAFGNEAGMIHVAAAGLIATLGIWLAGGWAGVLVLAVTIGLAMMIAAWIVGQLGGVTGDTYGALCEVSEVIFLMAAALAVSIGIG